jgi:peptide/nickel transport system permease protein
MELALSRLDKFGERKGRAAQNRFFRRFRRHKLGLAGLIMLIILAFAAIFAPLITLHGPRDIDFQMISKPPTGSYILGTDAAGRDIWARLVYGTRVSLSVGLVAVTIYIAIGMVLGGVAGYFGGWVDMLIMRFTDVMMCFPSFMLIITVSAMLTPSIVNIMIIIGIFGWTGICRLVRGQILSLREQDFVVGARCIGARSGAIIFRHILPNTLAPIVVAATMGLAGAIMAEAGLSFLGLGVQEPNPSWGSMVQTAMSLPVLDDKPWQWVPPVFIIAITVLAVNFAGDGLRDALDPRTTLD